jgi:hypothetical protein
MSAVTIEAPDGDSALSTFLRQEYMPYIREKQSAASPDIIISYREHQKELGFYMVKAPVSFDDEGVFLFDGLRRVCRVDWDQIGLGTVKIVCDPRFNPHFFAIIVEFLVHINFVKRGSFFCHACGFEWRGKTVLCPAWRNLGKTNLLLSLLDRGAKYIADDWVLIDESGRIRSLPKRLNLFYYNFEHHPALVAHLNDELQDLVSFTMHAVGGQYDLDHSIVNLLRNRLRVRVTPKELTGQEALKEAPKADHIFLLRRSTDDSGLPSIHPLDNETLSLIAKETVNYEQQLFHLGYNVQKSKTGRTNEFLESYDKRLKQLMTAAFAKVSSVLEIRTSGQQQAPAVRELIEKTVENGGVVAVAG